MKPENQLPESLVIDTESKDSMVAEGPAADVSVSSLPLSPSPNEVSFGSVLQRH